jgi:hypothetical protein
MAMNQQLSVRENRPLAPPCPPYMEQSKRVDEIVASSDVILQLKPAEDHFIPRMLFGGLIGGMIGVYVQ